LVSLKIWDCKYIGICGKLHHGNLEADRRIFLYKKAGPERAQHAMDAVYAWDQPDIDLYVPGGDHHFAVEAICFQKTLGGVTAVEHQDATG
jgi:hypothetical protein